MELCWVRGLKYHIFAWQIIIIGQISVLSSFDVFNGHRLSKIHRCSFLTFVQLSRSNLSAAPCLNHRFIALIGSLPDTSLRSLPACFDFSIRLITPYLVFPCFSFSSTIFIFALFFFRRLSLSAFSFRLRPLQATTFSEMLFFIALSHDLSLENCKAYLALEAKEAFFCSRSTMIVLFVQVGNTTSITKCVFVLYIQSMSFHFVVNVFLVLIFMIQLMLTDDSYDYDLYSGIIMRVSKFQIQAWCVATSAFL